MNCHLGGGGWCVTFGGTDSLSTHGIRIRFVCDKKGQKGNKACGCLWTIYYEWSTEGWVLQRYPHHQHHKQTSSAKVEPKTFEVSHGLIQPECAAELRTSSTGRLIPTELHDYARSLAHFCTPAQVHRGLQREAKLRNIDPNLWEYDDVLRQFPSDLSISDDFDATGLIEMLENRNEESGLKYFCRAGAAGHINKLFVELEEGRSDYARCGKLNTILFDPTHGTNRYGLKLCCFVTVGCTGQTVILALALIQHETVSDIEWAFRCFHQVFGFPPLVLKTDGAQAIASAFENCSGPNDIWEGTKHQLCVWHLAKNFYEHIRPVMSHDPELWRQCYSYFWKIAKTSDSQFADDKFPDEDDGLVDEENMQTEDNTLSCFRIHWRRLAEFVEQHGIGSTLPAALLWLESLYRIREKWAYCFAMAVIQWGINSTQRSESAHSAIKRGRSLAGNSLVRCIEAAIDYNADARCRKEVDDARRRLKQWADKALDAPEIRALHGQLTPYGMDLVKAQMAQILRYTATPIEGEYDEYGCQLFLVQFEGDSNIEETHVLPIDPETGEISDFTDDTDFGVGEGNMDLVPTPHITSVNMCSCQLKHVACRHILHIRNCNESQKGRGLDLLQLIGVKWHAFDTQRQSQLLQKLNHLPRRPQVSSQRLVLSRKERFELLMDEVRPLVQRGADSMDSMSVLLVEIEQLSRTLTQAPTSRSRAFETSPPPPEAAASAGVKLSTDSKSLKAALGFRFVPSAPPSELQLVHLSTDGRTLISSDVAYKWKHRNQGGWMVGTLLRQYDPAGDNDDLTLPADSGDTFVGHWNDGTVVAVNLAPDKYCSIVETSDNHFINSWCLLTARPLSDDVAELAREGNLHNPMRKAASGRPATKRLRPAHNGPGS